ncbi:hypothetical protein ACFV7R_43980 [Streptomyces sp. NPDC059866]|uniref:hypothetical protein n=1 Tax=Streptomyces sp. NPDC059866 TaxID=3346978 RepID=UPI00365464B4
MTIVKEFLEQGAPTRVRVLNGEDTDAGRRGDKKPIARSECMYYCPDEATARRCIDALEESDRRLRERRAGTSSGCRCGCGSARALPPMAPPPRRSPR